MVTGECRLRFFPLGLTAAAISAQTGNEDPTIQADKSKKALLKLVLSPTGVCVECVYVVLSKIQWC